MKKLLLTLVLAMGATFVQAQGTIQLANAAATRFRVNGAIPASASAGGPVGGTYVFGVFAGATADSLSAQPVGPLGTNSSTGGLISGPAAGAYPIPGFGAGSTAFIQIRAWESRYNSWDAGQEGLHGQTPVLSFIMGPESLSPGTVIWSGTDPTKFAAINLVPEPSTIALAVLGLGSLLLFRRRK